jgi:outer membrane protein assembly factor BamA
MLVFTPFKRVCWAVIVQALLCVGFTASPHGETSSDEELKMYAPSRLFRVDEIVLSGNKVTQLRSIHNELTFTQGMFIRYDALTDAIVKSRNNLLNTSLFNYVTIFYEIADDERVMFYVNVEERWYWWVFPIFEQTDRNISAFLRNNDWSRVNYGIYLRRDNFRGRRETLKFRLRMGYSNQFTLSFNSPDYNNKMGWGVFADYNMFDNLPYATNNDQPVYFREDGNVVNHSFASSISFQYRINHFIRHQLELSYYNFRVADTVMVLNPMYFPEESLTFQYVQLSYTFSHDNRNSRVYPLDGGLQSITLSKSGLGGIDNNFENFSALIRLRQYAPVSNLLYSGTEWTALFNSQKNLPYVLKNGIGYRDFISGYEYYVIDGPSYFYSKNKLLFELLAPRITHFSFIPFSKFSKVHYSFYFKIIGDFGYVKNYNPHPTNALTNQWLYGYGAGLELVTFYDKVFSVNYCVNKSGESGFYFHINLYL